MSTDGQRLAVLRQVLDLVEGVIVAPPAERQLVEEQEPRGRDIHLTAVGPVIVGVVMGLVTGEEYDPCIGSVRDRLAAQEVASGNDGCAPPDFWMAPGGHLRGEP